MAGEKRVLEDVMERDEADGSVERPRYRSVFRDGLFDERIAVVTGGGSGIGRCIAHELAALGATVVLWGRRSEPLERTAAEIVEDGGCASYVIGDIRHATQVEEAVATVVSRYGCVGLLVNNAGGQFSALCDVHDRSPAIAHRSQVALLRNQEAAEQVVADDGVEPVRRDVITADHGRGIPLMSHSSAARAGMANLTRTLAVEWAASGVRVNAVAPGFVASSGYDTYDGEPFHERLGRLPRLTLAQRHGTESEVSAAVVFLLSDAAAHITGQEILVAGGSDLMNGLLEISPHDRLAPYSGFHRTVTPGVLGFAD